MRYTKGKWVASRKDTYCMEFTLNKIIYAHISKLYECLKESKYHGVPMHYVEIQAMLDGVENKDEGDVDKADQLRLKDLEELLWVFGTEEPAISDYDFQVEMISGGRQENGNTSVKFVTTGESEEQRYRKDCEEYYKRKDAGYKLFGDIYQYLCW